ncbi:MAG: MFS transporter [Deltaproteobacteria bacterium RBG_13_49_15]|nr:MAG: MFS transporter [Deltaproteobacteria bacterium RBG_13_49_15]
MSFQKTNVQVIVALTLVHFTGDLYASFINPLLPVFADTFSLSLAQIGLLAGVNRFFMFVVQPVAGYFADHYRTRFFILGGPLLTMLFVPLVGFAPSFFILSLIIAVGSIGQSMFHPPVAGMISTYSGRNFSFSMSIFNVGGTFAFAVGPILITSIVRAYGLKAGAFSIAIGLPLMVYLFKAVPLPKGENLVSRGFTGSIREALGDAWKAVIMVWAIMVLRAFISQAWITFTPMLYAREGASLTSIGGVVSLFTLAGALSGLVAGHLADRIGYKPIFYVSHLFTAPIILLSVFSKGMWIYPSAFAAGFVALATLPLGVSLGQELAPKGKSMVSSLMMGLALGVGGMMSPLVGKLADLYTIRTVLCWLSIVPLVTTVLVIWLPKK